MKIRGRIILRITVIFVVLLALAGTWFYVVIWRPHQRFYRNETCWTSASTNEMRNLCHQIISHRLGCPHDAFLHLRHIGNSESVPLLIQALKWQKPVEGELYICTTAHCVDALRSLTGEDFGFSPSAWAKWWEQTGSKLPADHFHPRKLKKEKDSQPSSIDLVRVWPTERSSTLSRQGCLVIPGVKLGPAIREATPPSGFTVTPVDISEMCSPRKYQIVIYADDENYYVAKYVASPSAAKQYGECVNGKTGEITHPKEKNQHSILHISEYRKDSQQDN